MATEKTKTESAKSVKTKKGTKELPPLPPIDETTLIIGQELFKNLSPLNMDITDYVSRKTLIINESDLGEYLKMNLKLAKINELKSMEIFLMDNDLIEIMFEIQNFNSNSTEVKGLKIENGVLNANEAYLKFLVTEDTGTKANFALNTLLNLIGKYLLKTLLLPYVFKQLKEDKLIEEKENITVNLKEGLLSGIYGKTINQVLNTNVPLFGQRHLTDMLEIESIMCQKGQLWVDIIYKL